MSEWTCLENECCDLCGDAVETLSDSSEYFYDGQEVRCCSEDCPATGSIVAGPETPAHVDWHDIIRQDGEWIPNPEWEEFEQKQSNK